MSNSSPTDRPSTLDPLRAVQSAPLFRRPLTGVAFWAAIALPFLHLPLLASGLETGATRAAFLLLLALNVVMLVLGHSYRDD